MPLTDAEQRVCEAVAAGRDDLVRLAGDLIGFDTTARAVGDPPRDEALMQEYLAGWLVAALLWICGSPTPRRWPGSRWSRPDSISQADRS